MKTEVITEQETLVIRRMVLEPGEKMFWHRDACNRFTVVVSGDRLLIEYQDSSDRVEVTVQPGLADWEEPESRVHRTVNTGCEVYEEVVMFFRDSAEVEPQPGHAFHKL